MKPRIGITVGDPAGIGPEIAVCAALSPEVRAVCDPVLFGPRALLERVFPLVKGRVAPGSALGDLRLRPDLDGWGKLAVPFGAVSADSGRISYACLQSAVTAVLAHEIDAIATAPINKESLKAAGVSQVGHTEILASLVGLPENAGLTMFDTLGLRVFFFTRHVSLKKAVSLIKRDELLAFFRRCSRALGLLGVRGSMAVAGLNPHCGEHGLFGGEEGREIEPAVALARAEGIDVEGPVGADSVFHLAKEGRFAAVLSLYHDQGHIACKTLDFLRTVSLTLDLPFLRCSVDHGTAFDIAGTGAADPTSMVQAVLAAARYSSVPR
jgi:4-hydroxythreonine-4-phosphate dehydrogenase